jgi:hypothetical protein
LDSTPLLPVLLFHPIKEKYLVLQMISEGPALFVKASGIGSPIKALDSGQEISPKVPLLLPQISPPALEETSGETRETLPSFNTPSMGPLLR